MLLKKVSKNDGILLDSEGQNLALSIKISYRPVVTNNEPIYKKTSIRTRIIEHQENQAINFFTADQREKDQNVIVLVLSGLNYSLPGTKENCFCFSRKVLLI